MCRVHLQAPNPSYTFSTYLGQTIHCQKGTATWTYPGPTPWFLLDKNQGVAYVHMGFFLPKCCPTISRP